MIRENIVTAKCPECNYVGEWNTIIIFGCEWCGKHYSEFDAPFESIKEMLEDGRFGLDITKYEPYYRALLLEGISKNGKWYHMPRQSVAKFLDDLNMMAVDRYGGIRALNRKFLEILRDVTTNEEFQKKYQSELNRRDAPKRKERKKTSERPKYNPKKPRARERVNENARGWHKNYHRKT